LNNEEDKDAITDYLIEAKRLKLDILLPNVNASELGVSIEHGAIRLGLTNVKYISDNVGANIIRCRPYDSYADLETKVKEKGSGMNTRVLSAMNAIGGATFKDNPKHGHERDNFYEYLRIPAFGTKDLEPHVKYKFRDLDEFEEKGAFPVLAMVRKIRRGDGWALVDIIDETGNAGVFAGEQTPIEEGQMYAMLIADNRIAKYMTMDELAERINNSFSKFLYQRELTIPEDKFRVISFKQHRTKAGKNMAYIVLQDHMGALSHVLAFPTMYIPAVSNAKEGAIIDPQIAETQDGTLFIEGFRR
jgi:DNA polymerase-3 subunit alpha